MPGSGDGNGNRNSDSNRNGDGDCIDNNTNANADTNTNDITSTTHYKCQSDIIFLRAGRGIKMKELATEGIKIIKSLIIDVKEESMSNIHNLMNDVVVRYQQAFAHKAQAFLNSIGPNTSVNRPLPALCATTHK